MKSFGENCVLEIVWKSQEEVNSFCGSAAYELSSSLMSFISEMGIKITTSQNCEDKYNDVMWGTCHLISIQLMLVCAFKVEIQILNVFTGCFNKDRLLRYIISIFITTDKWFMNSFIHQLCVISVTTDSVCVV